MDTYLHQVSTNMRGNLIGLALIVVMLTVVNHLHRHTALGIYLPIASLLLAGFGVVFLILQRLPYQWRNDDGFLAWSAILIGAGLAAISAVQVMH